MTPVQPVEGRPVDKPKNRRWHAAAHLLSRHQWRETMMLMPQPYLRVSLLSGAQAAFVTLLALPLLLMSPWAHLVGYGALGALTALFGRFAPMGRRGSIVAQCGFWMSLGVVIMSFAAWVALPLWGQLTLLALISGLFFGVTLLCKLGPPGAILFVFGAGAGMNPVAHGAEVWERGLATAAVSAAAWALCWLTEAWRRKLADGLALPQEPERPMRAMMVASLRVTLAAGVAVFVAFGVGADHPAWAAMGVMAVLQGQHLHIHMNRAVQRLLGTMAGAAWVYFVLSQQPSALVILLLLVCCMVATEAMMGANYGLGQVLITPMALLMTYLAASPASEGAMVVERVVDTMIGAGVAMLLAVLFSTLDERAFLAAHHDQRVKG